MTDDAEPDLRWAGLERGLTLHRRVFFGGMALLVVIDLLFGEGWVTFWPMILWSAPWPIPWRARRMLPSRRRR